jgi:acyl carrier protein
MTTPSSGDVREIVGATWCRALRLDALPPGANLFLLGGDSLVAVLIASDLIELLNVEIVLTDLLEAPTFDEFVDRVTEIVSSAARA